MAGAGSLGLPLAAACLGFWSCRDFAGLWRPVPGLVSWAGTSVVNRGWADAGLPLGSLVDRRQLAPVAALTMYPSLAPGPMARDDSHGLFGVWHDCPPSLGAPSQKGWFGAFIVCTGQRVRLCLTSSGVSLRHSLGMGYDLREPVMLLKLHIKSAPARGRKLEAFLRFSQVSMSKEDLILPEWVRI